MKLGSCASSFQQTTYKRSCFSFGSTYKAREMNWKMNISVVDSGANEIFFEKMDGAYIGSRDIAFHKAQTAARFPFPTRFFQELAFGKDLKGGMVPGIAYVPEDYQS
jgi:uncharacterized protein GlcG (DUF336 family)